MVLIPGILAPLQLTLLARPWSPARGSPERQMYLLIAPANEEDLLCFGVQLLSAPDRQLIAFQL